MFKFDLLYYKLPVFYRFSLALILFGLALISRFMFVAQDSGGPYVTFYPAIILSFYFCGKYAGALVAVLSGLAGIYYFIPPYNQFYAYYNASSPIVFFSITSSLIGIFVSKLHRHIEEIHVILDNEMIGSMMLIDRKIIWSNRAMSMILGYSESELLGSSTKLLFAEESMFEAVGRDAYPLKINEPYRAQYEMRKADGNKIWIDISATAISYNVTMSLWLVNDISKLKALEEKLKHELDHDFLTGLRTRASFMSQALIELHRAVRSNTGLSLLMLDIDFFKLVNDSYGHQTGDIVLKNIAELIKNSLRDFDICARIGGEEFVIALSETNQDEALGIAERIRLLVENAKITPLTPSPPLQITVSIGLSSLNSKEDSIDALISRADQALYKAKNTGRNRVCISQLEITA